MSGFNKQLIIEPPKRIQEQGNQKNYATVSLFCLTVTNPFRDKVIRIVLNQWFDRFILLTIVTNCVFLAIDDPNVDPYFYQTVSDFIFLGIFTLEMFLKIIAMGFALKPYSYLRDGWNILDFIVVIMGWISKVVSANNVSAIRVIRILRPLRTINSMPGMRRLVQSLLNSLPTLFDILVLFLFYLVMFGTITTQLFGGLLQYRCVDDQGNIQVGDDGDGGFCRYDDQCPGTQVCVNVGNPDFGATSFDNILKSFLTIFVIITLEGWSDIMYKIRSATGTVGYDIVFLIIIIIGCFFILNLMVAAQFTYLNAQFTDQKNKNEIARQREEAQLLKIKADEDPFSSTVKLQEKEQLGNKFKSGFSEAVDPSNQDNTQNSDQKLKSSTDEIKDNNQLDSAERQNQNQSQQISNKGDQNEQNQIQTQQEQIKPKPFFKEFRVKLSKKCLWLIETKQFNIFTIILIMINTIFMAMEHYDQPDSLTNATNIANSCLTCMFGCEMVIKLFGLGIKNYIKDGFNDFDAIIVIVGLLEFVNAGSKALTVLRAFRLLRIFKIVKSWNTLRKLLQTVLNAISSIANLGLLMFLLMFIYALIGMQFLSGPIPDNQNGQFRFHFNSFSYSMITIFVLLTAENWNSTLVQFIDKDGWGASIYFVSSIIFGNIMLLNLFLAILLNFISENLDEENQELENNDTNEAFQKEEIVEEQFDYIQERLKVKAGLKSESANNDASQTYNQGIPSNISSQNNNQNVNLAQSDQPQIKLEEISLKLNLNSFDEDRFEQNQNEDQKNQEEKRMQQITRNRSKTQMIKVENDDQIQVGENTVKSAAVNELREFSLSQHKEVTGNELNKSNTNPESISQVSTNKSKAKKTFKAKARSTILNIQGRSLFLFSQNSRLRKVLKHILTHPYFENFIFHLIGLNSLMLAISEPVLTDNYQLNTMSFISNIVSGVFIGEAVSKIIVLGFVMGPNTYLKDPWNILDFVIVSFSVLSWVLDAVGSISVTFLRGFRALRALRPLRMVSKNEGMKIVVNSLLTSIPNLLNVMLINMLFLLVFGILAIQIFKGELSFCSDSNITFKSDCQGWYMDNTGTWNLRFWIQPFNTFDNIYFAMVTFFEVTTFENWPAVLFATIDSQGYDMGPLRDNRPIATLLYVVFIFVTNFFVMNLFISVIVDKFNEEIKKKEGSHNFSEEQKEWVKMQRIMVHVNLKIQPVCPEKNRFRKIIFIIVQTKQFEFFISFVIMINTLFLCMDYQDDDPNYARALQIGNILFVSIFALEAIMKMTAYGVRFYFLDTWNKFDFVIAILSLIALDDSLFSFKVNALRIIRVARLLRMIKASKGLRHLLKTVWLSMGNIANVGMLLFLVFFTFSVAGMDLFGNLNYGDYVTENANFTTFYLTFILLFRCATGENWNGYMHDCYFQVGHISVIYWVAFQLMTHFIFINIFVAVIYENFNDVKASEDENEVLSLKRKDIKAFVKTWAQFCPNGEAYLPTVEFANFLKKLPPPLGYEGQNIENSKLNKIIFCLNIKSHLKDNQGKVYFPEVMWAIFHSIIGNNDEKVHNCEQVLNIMKELKRKYKGLGKYVTPDSLCGNKYYRTEMTVSKYMCALQIYKNWKKFKSQRDLKKEQLEKSQKLLLDNQVTVNQDNLENREQDAQQNHNHFFKEDKAVLQKSSLSDQMKVSDNSESALLNHDHINNDKIGSLKLKLSTQNLESGNFGGFRKMHTLQNEEYKLQSKDAAAVENNSGNSHKFNQNQLTEENLNPQKRRKTTNSGHQKQVLNQNDFLRVQNEDEIRKIDDRNYLRSFGMEVNQFVSQGPTSQVIINQQDIVEGPDSSFQTEELSEDMSDEGREQKNRYLNIEGMNDEDEVGQEQSQMLDGANRKLRMNNKGSNQASKKHTMVDFAMIKGNMNLKDFINDQNNDNSPTAIQAARHRQNEKDNYSNGERLQSDGSEATIKNENHFQDVKSKKILMKAKGNQNIFQNNRKFQ